MARNTVVHIIDDIDGSSGAAEVTFSYDGDDFKIDLSKKNRAAIEKALKPYIDAATKVSRRSTRRTKSTGTDLAAVRTWARDNGVEVASRGRVPQSVIAQYEAAH